MGKRKIQLDIQTVRQSVRQKEGIEIGDWFTLHERFVQEKKLEGLRDRTISEHIYLMDLFKEWIEQFNKDCAAVDEDILKDYIAYMSIEKQYSPFTVNIRIRVLRCYCRWLYTEGYVSNNMALKLKLLKVPTDARTPAIESDIKKLLSTADLTTYSGFRDYCTILLILDTGIRIGEMAKLSIDDVDLKNRIIIVRPEVSKTNSVRYIPFGNKIVKPLQQLIKISKEMKSEYVFQSTYGGQIDSKNIALSINRLGKKAGVSVTPYQLRHTFATNFIKKGGDLFSLQRILGHSSMVTRVYVNLNTDDLKSKQEKYSTLGNYI